MLGSSSAAAAAAAAAATAAGMEQEFRGRSGEQLPITRNFPKEMRKKSTTSSSFLIFPHPSVRSFQLWILVGLKRSFMDGMELS